ncbi:MAG: metallophosphoesterase family protein [Fimbriiglobus sp.]
MRILLLSDIHANAAALAAIQEPHDVCLCLGDIVEYGPDNGPCIEWVRRHAHHAVRGNHDHGAAQNVAVAATSGFKYLTMVSRIATVAQLTATERRYLADLPTTIMLTLGEYRVMMVHASPRDPLDEYVPNDPAAWAARVAGLDVDFLFAGHTHTQLVMKVGRVTVVNPGSVGLQRDGDPRAKYAVIDNGTVELKQVPYNIDRTVAAMEAMKLDPKATHMFEDVYRHGKFTRPEHGNGKPTG